MSISQLPRPFRRSGQAYAFVVVAVIFLALLVSAGLRSTPSVLLVPLEESFGWSRATTSFSAAIGIFLYGLVGPYVFFLNALPVTTLVPSSLSLCSTGCP